MEVDTFVTTFIAALIVIRVFSRGRELHKIEIETGSRKGGDLFLYGWLGFVALLYYFQSHDPKIEALLYTLFGMLAASGVVYWGTVALRSVQSLLRR